MSEAWSISYDDPERGRVVLALGTPGPGRTPEEQAEGVFDELRALHAEGKAHNALVEVTHSTRRFEVVAVDIKGSFSSRQFDDAEAARVHAASERRSPWVSAVQVKQVPIVRKQRQRILDTTGRPI